MKLLIPSFSQRTTEDLRLMNPMIPEPIYIAELMIKYGLPLQTVRVIRNAIYVDEYGRVRE